MDEKWGPQLALLWQYGKVVNKFANVYSNGENLSQYPPQPALFFVVWEAKRKEKGCLEARTAKSPYSLFSLSLSLGVESLAKLTCSRLRLHFFSRRFKNPNKYTCF